MGKKTGIFAEPAGAITYGALKKLVESKHISMNDSVCLLVTGNGLKDPDVLKGSLKNNFLSTEEVRRRFNEN